MEVDNDVFSEDNRSGEGRQNDSGGNNSVVRGTEMQVGAGRAVKELTVNTDMLRGRLDVGNEKGAAGVAEAAPRLVEVSMGFGEGVE